MAEGSETAQLDETNSDEECYYETQVNSTWDTCQKNPGHHDFIPFDEFSKSHLSPSYQHDDIYELIKRLGYLVVKIVVKRTSTSRPKFTKENRPYPPRKNTIGQSRRLGSGRIWDVHKHQGQGDRPCECNDCRKSGNPKKSWGEVNVVTATHVVFDNLEGQFTQCSWNYNEPNRCNYVKFEGVGVGHADLDTDSCYLRCVTHDLRLIDKLKRGINLYNEQCEKVFSYFRARGEEANLIAIVSHPHGRHKHVSLGESKFVKKESNGDTTYSYTACTCSGSSGAPVYNLGKEKVRWANHHHSGSDNPLNYSAIGWM